MATKSKIDTLNLLKNRTCKTCDNHCSDSDKKMTCEFWFQWPRPPAIEPNFSLEYKRQIHTRPKMNKQEVLKLLKEGKVSWNNGIQLFVKITDEKAFLSKDGESHWVQAGRHLSEELLKYYGH